MAALPPASLRRAAQAVARAAIPLLVLATARPDLAETRPSFGSAVEGHASISLRPLPDEHSRRLLDSLAPAGRLREAARATHRRLGAAPLS